MTTANAPSRATTTMPPAMTAMPHRLEISGVAAAGAAGGGWPGGAEGCRSGGSVAMVVLAADTGSPSILVGKLPSKPGFGSGQVLDLREKLPGCSAKHP